MLRFRIRHSSALNQGTGDLPFAAAESWLSRNGAGYLWRAMSATKFIDSNGIEAAVECLGPEAFLPRRAPEGEAAAPGGAADSLGEATAALSQAAWNSDNVLKFDLDSGEFAKALFKLLNAAGAWERDRFFEALCLALGALAASGRADSDFELRFRRASEALGLCQGDGEMARLLVCLSGLNDLEDFVSHSLMAFGPLGRSTLARILGLGEAQTEAIFRGKLRTMDLICGLEGGRRCSPSLSPVFYELMNSPDGLEGLRESGPLASFSPARKPRLKLEDFFVDRDTVRMLTGLLSRESESPTHVLIHGPAGTGKTQFARALAASIGQPAYEVNQGRGGFDRRGNLIAADSFARRCQGGLVIVDEADRILCEALPSPLSFIFGGDRGGEDAKCWLDDFMERPGGRFLWIANRASGLPESIVRRFAFSLAFPALGRRERARVWAAARDELSSLGSGLLSDDSIRELAYERQISPGVICQSLRKSLEAGAGDEKQLVRYLTRQIGAYKRLSGRFGKSPKAREAFVPAAANSSPSAADLAAGLRGFVRVNRGLPADSRGSVRLLFHGASGTGKTELAMWLARELDLELVHGRISEILSPYVGCSEMNLRELFDRASDTGGLLLLDEVDSLLAARARLRETHDRRLVGEFLTGLESHRGVFVATTNRLSDLDPASLRRFSAKVEFRPMGPAGRAALFEALLGPVSRSPLTPLEKARLESIPSLAPGDFASTAEKCRWRLGYAPDNPGLLESLAEDAAIRVSQESREGSPPEPEGGESSPGGKGGPSSVN
ncbi:MAG: AAA family ATPase [Deltaproteobacteria bacterium]|jgi:DNA polymerase III delta prime subunit|nr:AAA family ATPase [Deltaproteobacteria bacterium]